MMKPLHKQFRTVQPYWISEKWLSGRMLFLSGPRQVGKTTLVKNTICKTEDAYFNWDNREVRKSHLADSSFFAKSKSKWICFDEIHKRPKWKDILKGIYDVYKDDFNFVITGSASLDTFKKSGDSLLGRYFHTHLFPLNLPDFKENDFVLPENPEKLIKMSSDLKDAKEMRGLLKFGGFPEPYVAASESFHKRWSLNHRDLILNEDLRDLTRVSEIDKIDSLLSMLTPSIGQTLSYRNLANDLETTHGSVRRWLNILTTLQLVFPVSPYSKNIRRAFKQEKKWYFVDWSQAGENRFENYVAASLMRAVTLWQDRFGEKMTLHFVRTHGGQEVDFLICKNGDPWLFIEAKEGEPDVSKALHKFTEEFEIPGIVVTAQADWYKKAGKYIYQISWAKFGQVLA